MVVNRDTLEKYYDTFRDALLEDLKEMQVPTIVIERTRRLIDYTLQGGKLNRGVAVLTTLWNIRKGNVSEEEMKQAAVLGWCIEWIQGSFLVADDMMDCAKTRRSNPCWYLLEGVGAMAINDAMLLMTQAHRLIRKYIVDPQLYYQIEAVITETIYQTELGQTLDMATQPLQGKPDLSQYTMARYEEIVKFKTAFYSFVAPVALGLLVAGVSSESIHSRSKEICLEMGKYFQIQDDVLDCYGTPEQIGKIGTDINDGKCSWLMVTALETASDEQKELLKRDYAIDDEECVARVKAIYQQLDLHKKFEDYENNVYAEINQMIAEKFPEGSEVPQTVFTDFLAKIFKRQK